MSVLHVQKASGIGGSERHLLDLIPALRARGVDARMHVLVAADGRAFVDALRARGVPVEAAPAGPDVNPLAALRIARAARSADLVHTHLIHADTHGQVAAALARTPGVVTIHGVAPFYGREPYRSCARAAGRLARRTIAISRHVERFVARHRLAPAGRVRVVPYGIDANAWNADRDRARASLGLDERAVAVGIAARLVDGKGHDVLIDAVAKALADAPDLRLVAAGDGPLRPALERRAAELLPPGTFRFTGFLPGVADFFAACDVVAFPSVPPVGEGFGLAALEAMAAGRAVVASRLDSLPEIVADERTGLLVAPGSAGELASALVALTANASVREALGTAGRERAAREFTLEAMVERTMAVYEEAIG